MKNFNPFGEEKVVVSVVKSLQAQASDSFTVLGADQKGGADKATLEMVKNGQREAIQFGVSVGNGRGSTRLTLTGDQIPSVREALGEFDLDATPDLDSIHPAECIRRTIAVEDGEVTFKVSLAKNSRVVRIPVSEWPEFLEYMGNVDSWTDAALEHYGKVIREIEGSANEGKSSKGKSSEESKGE